jgi:hypothetical protein
VEDLGAVREHRRCRLAGIEPPGVDLGDEGNEVGFDSPDLPNGLRQAPQQIVVGE